MFSFFHGELSSIGGRAESKILNRFPLYLDMFRVPFGLAV